MENENLQLNNERYGVESVVPLYQEKEEKGIARITRFEFNERDAMIANMRAMRDGGAIFRCVQGHYVRLTIEGRLVMSDTPMERLSNKEFIRKANGRVFIAGLGLGMIIHNIIDIDYVTEIVVVEKYQDVIDLVAPKFDNPKLKIICADIFDYVPEKNEKFDTIYFDIWTDIQTENLDEMKKLHSRFRKHLNKSNNDCFMNSWFREYLQKQRTKERKVEKQWSNFYGRNDLRNVFN